MNENIAINLDYFDKIKELILKVYDINLNLYKESFIQRRMSIAMNLEGVSTAENFYEYLSKNPSKINNLIRHLTINVSSFFRNQEVFNFLKFYLSNLIDKGISKLRIWSIGCSKGEEAYSVAMIIEDLNVEACGIKVLIEAIDINDEAISQAKQGIYSQKEIENVPENYRKYFINLSKGHYIINEKIKRYVKFKWGNLFNLKIFNNYYNIILCRNLLIFLQPIYHKMVYEIISKAIAKEGLLILGLTENLHPDFKEDWEVISRKLKIYKKK